MILDIEHIWIFMLALPLISFLYASIGHGGASGYLALMSLFSFPPLIMKPTALLLNIFVSGISFYYYYKGGYFNKKMFLYFGVASIPTSFWGGTLDIDATLYKNILGSLLIFAVLKMLNVFGKENIKIRRSKNLARNYYRKYYWFLFWTNRDWRRNYLKSYHLIVPLGENERSCSSICFVYMG